MWLSFYINKFLWINKHSLFNVTDRAESSQKERALSYKFLCIIEKAHIAAREMNVFVWLYNNGTTDQIYIDKFADLGYFGLYMWDFDTGENRSVKKNS